MKKILFFLLITNFLLISCGSDDDDFSAPTAGVSITINGDVISVNHANWYSWYSGGGTYTIALYNCKWSDRSRTDPLHSIFIAFNAKGNGNTLPTGNFDIISVTASIKSGSSYKCMYTAKSGRVTVTEGSVSIPALRYNDRYQGTPISFVGPITKTENSYE